MLSLSIRIDWASFCLKLNWNDFRLFYSWRSDISVKIVDWEEFIFEKLKELDKDQKSVH